MQSRLAVITYTEEDRPVFEDAFEVFWGFCVNSKHISHDGISTRHKRPGDVI